MIVDVLNLLITQQATNNGKEVVPNGNDSILPGFDIYGLVYEQQTAEGILPITCGTMPCGLVPENCDEEPCEPLPGFSYIDWQYLAPDSDKTGLIYWEQVKRERPLKSKCGRYMERNDVFRIIWWGNKCRLGIDKCCFAYETFMPYIYKVIPVSCPFQIPVSECSGINYRDVNITIDKDEILGIDKFKKWAYCEDRSKYLNTYPYESFSIDFKISYKIPLHGDCAIPDPVVPVDVDPCC